MTTKRPLLELARHMADGGPNCQDVPAYCKVLRAADALLSKPFSRRNTGYTCRYCGHRWQTFRNFPHRADCPLPEYERAVEAWERANG